MKNREAVIRGLVQGWLDKAESDLQAADILFQADVSDYFPCAFHCQQAVEKYLKAFLVRHQIEFRKTHDLELLLALAGQEHKDIKVRLESCVWLTPYGVEFRYPGEYPSVEKNVAAEALKASREVRQVVYEYLKEYLSQGQ